MLIFTRKSIIFTVIGALIGLFFYFIFGKVFSLKKIGIAFIVIFTLIGFGIATLKMPESTALSITRKTGGENLDDVILRAVKFKNRGKRLYVYAKEEEKR